MIEVIEKMELLLLPKKNKLPCLVFCLFLSFRSLYLYMSWHVNNETLNYSNCYSLICITCCQSENLPAIKAILDFRYLQTDTNAIKIGV
jgi:hypothetical protein